MTDPDLDDTTIGCFADGAGSGTDCVIDGLFAAGPAPELIGLLLGGTLISSLYIAGDGTVAVPAVVTILLGSVMLPLLPAPVAPPMRSSSPPTEWQPRTSRARCSASAPARSEQVNVMIH